MSLQHGLDGPGTLAPLFSAQITTPHSVCGLIHGTEYLHLMQVFLMYFPEYCHHFQMKQGQSRVKDGKLGQGQPEQGIKGLAMEVQNSRGDGGRFLYVGP